MAKKRAESRPTLEYILNQIKELKPRYDKQREPLERIRELRTKTRAVNVPKRLEDITGATGLEYRDASVEEMLWDLTGMFTRERPGLSLTTDMRGVSEDLTTRLEKFTDIALFEECGCREPGPSTYERLVDATLEGGGWTMLVKDKDLWDERYAIRRKDYTDDEEGDDAYDADTEKAKLGLALKGQGCPVTWVSLDTTTVIPIYFGTKLAEVIVVQKRSLSSTMRQFGLGFDGDGRIVPEETAVKDWGMLADGGDDGASIDFVQHWTATYCTYALVYEGSFKSSSFSGRSEYQVEQWRHGYKLGRPPVYYSPGRTRNYERGRVVGDSAAEPVSHLVEYVSQLRTIFGFLAIRDAMTPFLHTVPDGAAPLVGTDGKPKGPQVLELGMQYYGQPGQDVKPYAFPNNAEKLQAEIAAAEQKIKEMKPAAGGVDGPVGESGFALSVRFERDDRTNTAFSESIKRHLVEVARDLWRLCRGLDEAVYVLRAGAKDAGYVKIQPEEFDTPVRPTWKLNIESASAKIILQRYLEACVAAGFLGPDQAIEKLGENVDEVHKSIAKARVRGQPWFTQWEDGEILAEWGRGDLLRMQQQAEQMAAFTQQANMGVQMQPAGVAGMGQAGMPGDTGALAMGGMAEPGPPPGLGQIVSGTPVVPAQGATAQIGVMP